MWVQGPAHLVPAASPTAPPGPRQILTLKTPLLITVLPRAELCGESAPNACPVSPPLKAAASPLATHPPSPSMQPPDSGVQYSRWDGSSWDEVSVAAVSSTGEASRWKR